MNSELFGGAALPLLLPVACAHAGTHMPMALFVGCADKVIFAVAAVCASLHARRL